MPSIIFFSSVWLCFLFSINNEQLQSFSDSGLIVAGGAPDQMWRNIETFPVEASYSIPPFPRPGKIWNFLSPKTFISGRIRHTLSLIGNTLVACGGQDAPAMTTCISWQSGQSEWTDYYTLRLSFEHQNI